MGYPFNTRSAPHTRLTKIEQFRLRQDALRAARVEIAKQVTTGTIGGAAGDFVLDDDDGNIILEDDGSTVLNG